MNPPALNSADAQLVDWIREHCHLPGVTGFALCHGDRSLAAASFEEGFTQERLHDVWPAAAHCISAIQQEGGPAQEFRWQGRQRTFWVALRPDGAFLGVLHEKDLAPECRKVVEEAIEAFQGMPAVNL